MPFIKRCHFSGWEEEKRRGGGKDEKLLRLHGTHAPALHAAWRIDPLDSGE
jgi:hypothetical protein